VEGGPIRDLPETVTPDPPAKEPGPAEVRAELERILASRCFEQAARSSSFLRFVVEQTLAGQGERLKGYTIAVEVFGRPPDFDAQSDPLVRVEAGRLRRRLIEYYADEGRDDPVRIDLPRGSYSVACAYQVRAASEAPGARALLGPLPHEKHAAENEAARNRRRWRRTRSVLVAAIILAGLAIIGVQQFESSRVPEAPPAASTAVRDDGAPPILVLPFENLGGADGLAELAATLTEEMFLVLDRPATLVVATAAGAATPLTSPGYLLNGTVREADGRVRITARLAHANTGAQIWSNAYDEPLEALRSPAGQHRVARLVAAVAEPYGPLFDAELERTRDVPVDALRTRDCLLRYYGYRRVFAAAEHVTAVECFERVQAKEQTADALAGHSLLLADAWAHGFGGQGGSAAVLAQARELARGAMDIDGESLRANLALASAQFFSGAEFRETAERILTRWPENAEAQGTLGAMFVLTGDASRGGALVESAIEWTLQVPSGYYASRSLAALGQQRYADALTSALRIDAPDWALGHLVVSAVAALGGRADLAARARARLVELDPSVETSLGEVLRRWRVEPTLAVELERGFAAATVSR
jgi:adenylate cyclase